MTHETLLSRLRHHAATLRTNSMPLKELIPLLTEAADALDREHNARKEARAALSQPVREPGWMPIEAVPVATKFAAWSADNGLEVFDTEAEALEYAAQTLKAYRDDAKFDGEWPDDTEDLWVGAIHITHKSRATEPDEQGGVDFELRPVSTHPAPSQERDKVDAELIRAADQALACMTGLQQHLGYGVCAVEASQLKAAIDAARAAGKEQGA